MSLNTLIYIFIDSFCMINIT